MKSYFSIHRWNLFFIAVATLLFHFFYFYYGFELLNSDWAVFHICGQEIANSIIKPGSGEWRPFCYQQSYGGNTFTLLRAFWLVPFSSLGANLAFTYLFTPLLMNLTCYWLCTRFVSGIAPLVIAISFSAGLPVWIENYSSDFYFGAYLLGILLLGMRAGVENPWREWSARRWLWVGVLMGLALYTWRAAAVFCLPILLPLSTPQFLKEVLLKAKTKLDRWLVRLFFTLVLFWFYILCFGSEFSTPFGKNLKIEAWPNLQIALVMGAVLVVRKLGWTGLKKYFRNALVLTFGVVLGILPEIIYRLRGTKEHASLMGNTEFVSVEKFVDFFRNGFFQTLVDLTNGMVLIQPQLVLKYIPFALFIFGVVALLVRGMKDRSFFVPLLSLCMGLVCFFALETYTYGMARYLAVIVPVFWIGGCILYQGIASKIPAKGRNFFAVVFVLLVWAYPVAMQAAFIQKSQDRSTFHAAKEVNEVFASHSIELVMTDDYWKTNQFTLVAPQFRPLYVSIGRAWHPDWKFGFPKYIGLMITRGEPRKGKSEYFESMLDDPKRELLKVVKYRDGTELELYKLKRW